MIRDLFRSISLRDFFDCVSRFGNVYFIYGRDCLFIGEYKMKKVSIVYNFVFLYFGLCVFYDLVVYCFDFLFLFILV